MVTDGNRIRLPNAVVNLIGDVPDEVTATFADLDDDRLHLSPTAESVTWAITRTDGGWDVEAPPWGPLSATPAPQDLTDLIVGRCNQLAFHLDRRRLHLHAAAVELDGVGILLAGRSGSGKSTVLLELLRRGAAYLGDESVTLLPGSRTVFAYPKPVTLKTGSLRWAARERGHPAGALIPARNGRAHLRAGTITDTTPFTSIGVVVSVRYRNDAPTAIRTTDPSTAAVSLLSDSLDGIRMGPGSLEVVAPILAGASSWQLDFTDASEAAELIAQLRPARRRQVAVPYRVGVDATKVTGEENVDRVSSLDISTRIVCFDEAAVLCDGPSGSLLRMASVHPDEWVATAREQLGPGVHLPTPGRGDDPLSFGLPGMPVDSADLALRPLTATDVDTATAGNCTGVLVDQLRRGRRITPELFQVLAARHTSAQITCALLDGELPAIVGRLHEAGVRPVVLGGPVAAHDGPLPEWFCDYDTLNLLVRPEELDTAHEAAFDIDPGCTSASTGALRIRSMLVDGPLRPRLQPGELQQHAVPVRIGDRWFSALCPAHRFLYGCLQVGEALHDGSDPPLHLLRDLALMAPRTPDEVDLVNEGADRWGAGSTVETAMGELRRRLPESFLSWGRR